MSARKRRCFACGGNLTPENKSPQNGCFHQCCMDGKPPQLCEHRPLCNNIATGAAPHEITGTYPICDECRAELDKRTAAAITAAGR